MKAVLILFLTVLHFPLVSRAQVIIAFQGFESGDSFSYTANPGNGSISTVTSPVAAGLNALRLRGSSNNSDPNIVFSNVATSGYDNVVVKVSYAASGPDLNDDLYVDLSFDNGQSYPASVKLADGFSNGSLLFGNTYNGSQAGTCCIVSQPINPYIYTIPAADSQVRIRIRFDESASTNTSDDYFIDNITVEGIPKPVDAPALPLAAGVSHNGFSAIWNGVAGATGYQVDLSTFPDFTVNIYDSLVVADTSIQVTSLTENTEYFFRVRTIGANGISGNSDTLSVLTNHDPTTASYRTSASGGYKDAATWQVNINASTYVPAVQPPGVLNPVYVQAGDTVTLDNIDTVSAAALSIGAGSVLGLNPGAIFNLSGDLINNGLVIGGGRLTLNGGSAQTISGTGSLAWLQIDNINGVNITSGTQRISGILALESGTLSTNGNLVLESTGPAAAACVAPVTGGISGLVKVERYLSAPSGPVSTGRAWRLIGTPLTGTTGNTIYNNWQNNGVPNGGGLEIWGPAGTGIAAGPHYSLKKYDPVTNGYLNVTNTQSEVLFDAFGSYAFLAFVSGSYRSGNIAAGAAPTVVSASGQLMTGTQSLNFGPGSTGLRLIANPYACPVDFEKVFTNSGTTNISPKFWVIDPNLNEIGGYVLVSRTAANNYITVPSGVTSQNQFIQPGQAFFVELGGGGSATLEINEDDKEPAAAQTPVFRTNNGSLETLEVNLKTVPMSSVAVTIDGTIVVSHNSYSNSLVASEDALKISNPNESISILSGNAFLAMCGRPLLDAGDTVKIAFAGLRERDYELEIVPANMAVPGLGAMLYDSYSNSVSTLSLTSPTVYPFSVTQDTLTSSNSRFFIVFQPIAPLSNWEIRLSGCELNGRCYLHWTGNSSDKFQGFQVERSMEGLDYSLLGSVTEHGDRLFIFEDKEPGMSNFYRIRSIDKGIPSYSNVVQIRLPSPAPMVKIWPNPLKDNLLQVLFGPAVPGQYEFRISNVMSIPVRINRINHNGKTSRFQVDFSGLPKGVYLLQAFDEKGTICTEQSILLE